MASADRGGDVARARFALRARSRAPGRAQPGADERLRARRSRPPARRLHLRQRAGAAPRLQLGDRRHLRPLDRELGRHSGRRRRRRDRAAAALHRDRVQRRRCRGRRLRRPCRLAQRASRVDPAPGRHRRRLLGPWAHLRDAEGARPRRGAAQGAVLAQGRFLRLPRRLRDLGLRARQRRGACRALPWRSRS